MQDIKFMVPDGKTTPAELGPVFDQEIEDFSKKMETIPDGQGGGTLSKAERMLLKTYLVFKVTGRMP